MKESFFSDTKNNVFNNSTTTSESSPFSGLYSTKSMLTNLLVSPELHDYINYASSLIGPEAAGSFTWAIGYHGVSSLFGVETGPSPVTSFARDSV